MTREGAGLGEGPGELIVDENPYARGRIGVPGQGEEKLDDLLSIVIPVFNEEHNILSL